MTHFDTMDFSSGYRFLGLLIFVVVLMVPFWHITRKAGYPPSLSLLLLVPIVNLFFLYYLAFSQWESPEEEDDS